MDITSYILSKKYIEDSLAGAGALVGKSAYQIACDNGFQGTEQDWLNSLIGESPTIGANGNWFIGKKDTGILASPSLAGYATEDWVKEQIANITFPEVDLTLYATKQEIKTAIDEIDIPEVDLSNYPTKQEVKESIDAIEIPEVDLSDYATKDDLKNVSVDLEGYATESYVDDKIAHLELSSGAIVESLTQGEILDILTAAGGNAIDIEGNQLVAMTEQEVKEITSK